MLKKPFFKVVALYLIVSVSILTLPAQGWAMFIPSSHSAAARTSELETVQKALETSVVKQRLADYGLSSAEVMSRIDSLSDAEIHRIASNLDSLQAGADGVDLMIFLLLVAILVVVLLQVTGHRVMIR